MKTGREPRLISSMNQQSGFWRLSPRRLATMLQIISPEAASIPAVEAMMHSSDFFVRYGAAKLLARRGDREARMVMQRILETGSAPSRASAARHLYGFSWYTAEPMLRKALSDEDPRVREGAVYALCQMQTYEAYQLMLETLADEPHDEVRGATIWGLRDRHDPLAVQVLEIALDAKDPDIRAKITDTLSSTEMPEAIPVVRRTMLTDEDSDVIYNAALSYIELAEENCFADFADFLMQADGVRLQYALRGFFHATNYLHLELVNHPMANALIDTFERAIQHEHREIRKQAVWPLAWTRHPRTPEIVLRAYKQEQDIEVKAHFMRVAVSLMMPESDLLLRDALASSRDVLRELAEQIAEEQLAA